MTSPDPATPTSGPVRADAPPPAAPASPSRSASPSPAPSPPPSPIPSPIPPPIPSPSPAPPPPPDHDVDIAAAHDLEDTLKSLPPRYEPNALLRWLYRRFFDAIAVDSAWCEAVRAAAARGTVVYALRNLSLLDFLALDHITKRYGLPQVRFANDLGLWILEPFGKGVRHALRPRTRDDDLGDLRAAVGGGASAVLFLKRPPTVILRPSATGRGLLEGDDFVRELLELQRERRDAGDARPIIVIPQVFVWTKRPDTRQRSIVDAILGTREWPNVLRMAGQFLANYRDVTIRAGEPLDLAEFLATEEERPSIQPPRAQGPAGFAVGDGRTDILVRRAIYVVLRRLERERRVILGPVVKPSDRLVEEIVRTPRIRALIEELAGEGRRERIIVEARARAMLREMAAGVEADVIRAMGMLMEQVFHRIYDGLEIDREGLERLREASRRGTVILLPSHKSHIDYLLISYVMWKNDMNVPLIAAGDNLAFFPLGALFRRCGAFFIRRKIGNDRLYAAVLDAYVHKIVREGYSLEFFLEGGRSRTGKLLAPKLGLLSMVVDVAVELPSRPIFFVPISIGYERVVEARSYARELAGGEKEGESVAGLVRSIRLLAERYGRLNLQIGDILTVDRIRRDVEAATGVHAADVRKRAIVARLGYQITYETNRATMVTGGALVAMALLVQGSRGVPRSAVVRDCDRLLAALVHLGARVQPYLRAPDAPEGASTTSAPGETTEAVPPAPSPKVSRRALDDALALFGSAGWIEPDDGEPPVEGERRKPKKSKGRAARRGGVTAVGGVDDEARDPVYVIPDDKRLNIDQSKNVILHFFVPYALIATALLVPPGPSTPVRVLRDRVQKLSRLFKYEFMFRGDASFDDIFDQTLADLLAQGAVTRSSDVVIVAEGGEGRALVELYAATIASFLEGYRIAARSLVTLSKGPTAPRDLAKRALAQGRRMYLAGEIVRREAICRPVIENALSAFLDQGYLARSDGKLVLSESFAKLDAVRTIEQRVAMYLAWTRAFGHGDRDGPASSSSGFRIAGDPSRGDAG